MNFVAEALPAPVTVVERDPSARSEGSLPTPGEAADRARRRRLIQIGAVAGVVLAVVLAHELVVAELMHRSRHGHLVANYGVPSPAVAEGDALAALQVPALELNEVVIEGDSDENLRAGPAHRRASPIPGQTGNAVILGHATRYGGPFASLRRLRPGDPIFVQPRNASVVRFDVKSVERVESGDTAALAPSSDRRLTLVTSAGRFTSDRLVVVATADVPGAPGEASPGSGGGFNPTGRDGLLDITLGLAIIFAALAGAAFRYLARRHRTAVAATVAAPVAVLALLLVLRALESVLPSTL